MENWTGPSMQGREEGKGVYLLLQCKQEAFKGLETEVSRCWESLIIFTDSVTDLLSDKTGVQRRRKHLGWSLNVTSTRSTSCWGQRGGFALGTSLSCGWEKLPHLLAVRPHPYVMCWGGGCRFSNPRAWPKPARKICEKEGKGKGLAWCLAPENDFYAQASAVSTRFSLRAVWVGDML